MAACFAIVLGIGPTAAFGDIVVNIGGRISTVFEPTGYDDAVPAPLLVVLHGYTMSGQGQEDWTQFASVVDDEGFLYTYPDGLVDPSGSRFWNTAAACCNFWGNPVDDVAYVKALIDEIGVQFNVDARRIYIFGYSNGGFMAHRMACDHADTLAAVVSLAGAAHANTSLCVPADPIHVLQIHGTSDATILYAGGSILGNAYPGAVSTTNVWRFLNDCTTTRDTSAPPLDLLSGIAGDETTIEKFTDGCFEGGSSELWTMAGAPHFFPDIQSTFTRDVMDYLIAHPKPVPEPGAALGWLSCVGVLGLLARFRRS